MTTTTWAKRQDLDKATIETLLREIDGVDRLGKSYASETVAYPVTGVDVLDAVRYIMEKDVVGSFAKFVRECKTQELSPLQVEYEIPVGDRRQQGRSTPKIVLSLNQYIGDTFAGKLYHIYSGKHEIVTFLEIPREG